MAEELLSSDPIAGLHGLVDDEAAKAGLDPSFVRRIVGAESNWNPSARSSKGALGLMQLMPATAKDYGVTDLLNPSENVRAGVAHLARLNTKYGGDQTKVAAAYNAGEGNVDAHGGVPPFPETQGYVNKVVGGGMLSSDPDAGKMLSSDPDAGVPVKAVDQKKEENRDKYKAANPQMWQKIVAAAKNAATHPLDTAASALPLVGGAVGGVYGGVTGAAIGGAAGAGFEDAIKRGGQALAAIPDVARNLVSSDPDVRAATRGGAAQGALEGVKNAGFEGAVQGALQGVGSVAGKAADVIAPRLYQSALKPAAKLLKPVMQGAAMGGLGTATQTRDPLTIAKGAALGAAGGGILAGVTSAVSPVITRMLNEDIPVSAKGIAKVEGLLQVNEGARKAILEKSVANHPEGLNPFKITANLSKAMGEGGQLEKFVKNVNPQADLDAISKVGENFLSAHGGSSIPVDTANAMKQATYAVNKRAYGRVGGAGEEAEKVLASGLRNEVNAVAPGLEAVDQATSELVKAKRGLEARVAVAANRDPVGFAWVTKNPQTFVLALMDRSPAFKSLIARGLWKAKGAALQQGLPNVFRLGILAAQSLSGDEEKK